MSPDEPDDRRPDDNDEPPAPDHRDVRRALLGLSELIQRLEEEGKLLHATPYLLGKLGDLRHLLFAYEVRTTGRIASVPVGDALIGRVVNPLGEAIDGADVFLGVSAPETM